MGVRKAVRPATCHSGVIGPAIEPFLTASAHQCQRARLTTHQANGNGLPMAMGKAGIPHLGVSRPPDRHRPFGQPSISKSRLPSTGHSSDALAPVTVPDLVAMAAAHYPDRVLFKGPGPGALTYREVADVARRMQSALAASGVGEADRVALLLGQGPEAFALFYAIAATGAIAVPIDLDTGHQSLGYILGHCEPTLLFCDDAGLARVRRHGWPPAKTVVCQDQSCQDAVDLKSWLDKCPERSWPGGPGAEGPAALLYTSGSTGHPQGVLLSHRGLCGSASAFARYFAWRPDDVFFNLARSHTMSGLRNSAITPLYAGSGICWGPAGGDDSFFDTITHIEEQGCSLLGCGPVFLRLLQRFHSRIAPRRLASLRAILCTGAALDPELTRWIYRHYGLMVLNYYGLTETSGFCTGHSPASFLDPGGGIGFPVGARIDIIGENGMILPEGEIGELRVSSPNLMIGYFRDPQATAAVMRNGYLFTGDLALRTPAGTIQLKGRKRHFIKTARTELVCFEEVELTLERHPLVREAAVCGFASGLGDEKLAAFIVPSTPAIDVAALWQQLQDHIGDTLGRSKAPGLFIVQDSLPRNSAGKLLRSELERKLGEWVPTRAS